MPYLIAGVVLVGALCLLNLVFTLGVIRRLRDHSNTLSAFTGGAPMLKKGAVVGDFTATTVDGTPVSRNLLEDDTLVGVFSTTCPACVDQLPSFVAAAERTVGGATHVLAVVVGSGSATDPFVDALRPVAQVVVEAEGGPVGVAFEVRGYPAIGVVGEGGVMAASGSQVSAAPEAATV